LASVLPGIFDSLLPRRPREFEEFSLFVDITYRELKIGDGFVGERSCLKDEMIFDAGRTRRFVSSALR